MSLTAHARSILYFLFYFKKEVHTHFHVLHVNVCECVSGWNSTVRNTESQGEL